MAKRNHTSRKRRTYGGFRMSFDRDQTQRTLNPFTWFRSNTPIVPLEEVVVNKIESRVAEPPSAPNTVIEVREPAPNSIRIIGEANAAGIPPTPPPGTLGFKVEGGRRRKRSASRKARSASRKSRSASRKSRSASRKSRSASRSASRKSRSASRSAYRKH